ncbi:MAG: FtsX-like permease family protein [Caldimonas sp.]
MIAWLRQLSWPELRHHPWRAGAAFIAVLLGVALAFSVHLINQSALGEFSAAVRSINGEPDFELRGPAAGFDEALYARVAAHPRVAVASPIVEIETAALDPQGRRVALRVLGIDALVAGTLAPALLPRVAAGQGRYAVIDPATIFLNPQAQQRLGANGKTTLQVLTPRGPVDWRIGGGITAPGPPLAVVDIAGAQGAFDRLGRLQRIDVRLVRGANRAAVLRELELPAGVRAADPDEAAQRVSNVSRAYRVNLTVLALVALFTGAFLVFSILSLSVAQRQPQLALLGVLGLSARERLRLVLVEAALLGAVGSVAGLAVGTALAALALRWLGGDLGGGYFAGVSPELQFSAVAALVYVALGIAAAVVGGWLPARAAGRIAPAQGLKGLAGTSDETPMTVLGPVLLVAGIALALLPPIADIPLAAYGSVACLLLGGIACVPGAIGLALRGVPAPRHPLALLAVERARRQRDTATIAVAGVVASLSLAVALTVMVGSFRESVLAWLDTVLPADLYVRSGSGGPSSEPVTLPAELTVRAASIGGVTRVESQRVTQLQLDPAKPTVALIARTLDDPAARLPLVGTLAALPPGRTAAYVSEAMVDLYDARTGTELVLPMPDGTRAPVHVRGVWRDYARQHGAVVLASADYQRLTGDLRSTDIALWLRAGTEVDAVRTALRRSAGELAFDGALLEFAEPGAIRTASLRIFDRSFAVTYWLQAVAIGIGLFGIGASFSAQVLARRKEFGLLAHLGFTRRQVLGIVGAECAVWTAAGALLGLLLGLAVSVVLVKVVNPQSFHWTMDLSVPWGRLALLCAAVLIAGTATGWLAARGAASRQLALAVKEDW